MGRKERPAPKEKEEVKVITAKPNELELLKFWQDRPAAGIRINFPVDAQTGAASSAAVYFEVESEQHIGRHTHSAEEILFVLEGEAEAVVGDEREDSPRRRWRWFLQMRPTTSTTSERLRCGWSASSPARQ